MQNIIRSMQELSITINKNSISNIFTFSKNGIKYNQEHSEDKNGILFKSTCNDESLFEYTKDITSNYVLNDNIISLGICSPTCNMACKFCTQIRMPLFPSNVTSPESLDYFLNIVSKNNKDINITFFNNEPFNNKEIEWQSSIASVLNKYSDNISSILFFTNIKDVLKYNPLLDKENKFLNESTVSIGVDLLKLDDHLSIEKDIDHCVQSIIKLRGIGLFVELNIIVDISEKIKDSILKNLITIFELLTVSDSMLKISIKNKKNIFINDDSVFSENIELLMHAIKGYSSILESGRLSQTLSLLMNKIKSPVETIPTFHIHNTIMTGITTGRSKEIKSYNDIYELIKQYTYDLFPNLTKCNMCEICALDYDEICEILKITPKCRTCILFGSCSGFFYNSFRSGIPDLNTCDEEFLDVFMIFSLLLAAHNFNIFTLQEKILDKNFIEHFNSITTKHEN